MRSVRALSLVVVAAALLASACSGSTGTDTAKPAPTNSSTTTSTVKEHQPSGPSAGCDATAPAPPGTTDNKLTSGNRERSFQMTVPEGYDGAKPYALVFGFHSLTVDYHIVASMSGFDDMQKDYDFVSVTPSGLISTAPYWNAAPVAENYDLQFVSDLLDHLEATLCLDTAKVFSVGMSNGAQMSSMIACRLGGRIAAIAPIAGVEYNEPCDTRPTPVIAFHGTADPFVPYAGGGLNSRTIAEQNFYKGDIPSGTPVPTGVDESMNRWARRNGCEPDFTETSVSPSVRKRTWNGCAAATDLYIIEGGGHQWPGKPQPAFEKSFGPGTTEIDATGLAFALFFHGTA